VVAIRDTDTSPLASRWLLIICQKYPLISDITKPRLDMSSIPSAIRERSQLLRNGGVLAPKEFLHLGSRAAVDQAFCRLVKAGHLIRVARGIYALPLSIESQGHAPSAESVAKSIAAWKKQAIAPTGQCAANSLGLALTRPVKKVLLTNGRSLKVVVGDQTVELQRAPYWMLSLGNSLAGDAVRTLAWIGRDRADGAAAALRQRLPDDEWSKLSSVRASLPSWMATAIGRATMDNHTQTG